jgi:hypothetical protein
MNQVRIFAMTALIAMIAGCGPTNKTRVVGGNGFSTTDHADVSAAVAVAQKYTRAWVDKDYARLYYFYCPCTMERTIPYKGYLRATKAWREIGVLKIARPADIQYAKISSSFGVMTYVSDTRAMIELASAVSDDGTAEKLKNGTWPERSLFLRDTIADKPYVMMLVKNNGKWSVMCAPGQLSLESSGLQ